MTKKTKTILMGTPEFAARIFKKFYDSYHSDANSEHSDRLNIEIVAVVTASDKPVGRKQKLIPSPVKKWALENRLKVLQPEKIREPKWIKKIQELNPDLIILCAYGQIIPKEILDIPKRGALNIHPSMLPKYRGASPIQATILNDDKDTGVTIILMDEKMDHGDIISQFEFSIPNDITHKVLANRLAITGAKLLINTLPDWVEGKIKPRPQNHSKATFCKIIKKEDGKIDWNKSAEEIERMLRAFEVWPNAYTLFNDKQLKILEAELIKKPLELRGKAGEVFLDEDKNLCVQTRNRALILKKVQLEGKKSMPALDFRNGHPEIIGSVLQ